MEAYQENGNPGKETESKVYVETGGLEKTYGEDWDSSAFCGTRNKCKLKHGANPSIPRLIESLKFE